MYSHKPKLARSAVAVSLLLSANIANATLIDRGNGLIYDDVLNVTWLQDANLAATETFGVTGIDLAGGMADWYTAQNWIDAMNAANYKGFNDWRLPSESPINGVSFDSFFSNNASTDNGYAKSGPGGSWRDSSGNPVSELGYMFYVNLNNLGYCQPNDASPYGCVPQPGWGLVNIGPFINVQSTVYWTGGTFTSGGVDYAFGFNMRNGSRGYFEKTRPGFRVWAVRDGDVAKNGYVPEPSMIWLLGVGIIGMFGLEKRKQKLRTR